MKMVVVVSSSRDGGRRGLKVDGDAALSRSQLGASCASAALTANLVQLQQVPPGTDRHTPC